MSEGSGPARALAYDRAVSGLFRRIRGGSSIEDERERLRYAQEAAARQLEAMKQELAERVQAIRDRERALDDALGVAPAEQVVSLPPAARDAATIDQRERALAPPEETRSRYEQKLAQVAPDSAGERQLVEQRLAELHKAEKLFLQTQSELASRSEVISARERLLASRERALGDGGPSDHSEVAELEARLRRLEQAGMTAPADNARSFAGGLEALRRRGTRRQL